MLIELKKVFREEIKRVLKEFSYSRTSTMELREKLENQNQCYVPVSQLWVEAKAHSIYEDLSKDNDNTKPFNASSGWFLNFMKRYNFHNIKMRGGGGTAPADTVTAEVFVKELQHSFERGSY